MIDGAIAFLGINMKPLCFVKCKYLKCHLESG